MTDTQAQIPSVVDRTRLVAAGAPVVATHFLRQTAAFALGEEALLLVAPDGAESRVAVHEGGVLAVASDSARILTGGDDGKVVVTNAKGHSETLATDARHRWIDRVALGPDGVIAWSAGKQAFVRTAKGEIRALDLPSSVGGLAAVAPENAVVHARMEGDEHQLATLLSERGEAGKGGAHPRRPGHGVGEVDGRAISAPAHQPFPGLVKESAFRHHIQLWLTPRKVTNWTFCSRRA